MLLSTASMPAPVTALGAVLTFAVTELPNDVVYLESEKGKEELGGFTGGKQW